MVGIVSLLTPWAKAQPSVTVHGTLKGYFLTPQGELVRRKIPLTSSPVSEPPKEQLHLLWAGYYFEGWFKSAQPIKSLTVFADSQPIWKREFPKSVLQGAVPDLKLPLQIHTRYGDLWKVRMVFEDGATAELPLRPVGVQFKPVLTLKIDWLDLVRIKAVKNFLTRYGDRLFPGWNAARIPFALQGEGGQWVFINHPKPPKGARRYRGLSPLKADIWVIDRWLAFSPHPEAAEAPEIERVSTVVLPFRPYWFALPDYDSQRNAQEALMRLATILHECFHAWYAQQPFQRLAVSLPHSELATNEFTRLFSVLKSVETELLNQALTTQDIDRRNEALQRFLALRRFPPDKPEYQTALKAGQTFELAEGVASFLEDQAFKLLMERWHEYYPLLSVDPFLPKQKVHLSARWRSYLNSHYFTGAAQLTLLEQFGVDWKQHLRTAGFRLTLDELLSKVIPSKAVAWRPLSPDEESKIAQNAWKQVEERSAVLKQAEEEVQGRGFEEFLKRSRGEKVGLWVKVEFPKDFLTRFPPPKVPLDGWWQENLDVSVWDCQVKVRRLCWVSQETMQSLVVRVYLPMEKDEVLWFRWHEHDLGVKGEGFELYLPQAHFVKTKECLWLVGQSRSLSGENPLWARRVTNMKRAVWLAASLTLLLAMSSNEVRAQVPEGVTVTATITGNFRDADTGQIAYLTLDALDETNNPPGNWHTIVDEQYTLSVTMESTEPQPMSITLLGFGGQELARAESTQPTQRLSVQGQDTSPYGCQTKHRVRLEAGPRHFPTCQTIWGIWLAVEPYHVPVPPPQFGTVVVHVFDGATGQPLRGAGISIPEAGISDVTNEQGIWTGKLQVDPKKGTNYTINISSPYQSIAWCVIQRKIKLYAQGTYETRAWLWEHRPIVGRIQFEGRPGDPQQATVKATKGDQTLTGVVNSDGSFVIPGYGGTPEAGEWIVTVTYPGALSVDPPSRKVVVPNNCQVGAIRPGSHSPVDAGVFTIKLPFPGGPGGG